MSCAQGMIHGPESNAGKEWYFPNNPQTFGCKFGIKGAGRRRFVAHRVGGGGAKLEQRFGFGT